ncbi:acyl-CoA dehydrogenase family protein [Jatrophihabitans sp.]|uniref:acyl-CoA dehydrogenase family protein n=1 Tax=Jatrophihabitans sp. TaxID=1932789 RepID=UPI0030C7439D|nr:acyl-CoA dehydrogenase [Jatrophihabitans sp.]
MTAPTSLEEYRVELRDWLSSDPAALRDLRGWAELEHERYVALGQELSAITWERGFKRFGWPVEVGGLGGGPRYRAVYYDELCAAGLFVPEGDFSGEVLGPAVIRYAPALAAEYGAAMLSGRELWGQGFSEPEAGSDLAALRTRATPTEGGYLVNGQKVWTSNGHLADRLFTLVRTGPADSRHRGISVLFIDADSPGVLRRPLEFASGAHEMCETFFDDVTVPTARRIGAENEGWAIAMFLLQFERAMYSAQRQAWLLARLRELAAQLRRTGQSGDPAAADVLGRAWLAVSLLRTKSAQTVARLDAGETVGPAASADKVLLAAAEQGVLDAARELLGAGFDALDENASWRAQWWYSRASSIYGGSAEIQRTILADRVLGLPPEQARAARIGAPS